MKKIIFSFIMVTIVAILVLIYFVSESKSVDNGPNQESVDFGESLNTTDIEKEKNEPVPVGTVVNRDGSFLTARDFISDSETELIDAEAGVYSIAEGESSEGTLYEIFYFTGGSITVSLLNENLSLARNIAEEELLEKLAPSTNTSLCNADISVTTPWSVSDEYSGFDLGLSFCPNSIEL